MLTRKTSMKLFALHNSVVKENCELKIAAKDPFDFRIRSFPSFDCVERFHAQ